MIYGVGYFPLIPPVAYSLKDINKYTVPVDPEEYIYSHFRHVAGTPAPEGEGGISISRLKILDTLIEQLSQLKKGPSTSSKTALSEKQIDALIEQYTKELRAAQTAHHAFPYKPNPSLREGTFFNMVA
ncbi:MAG: hypothetical protein N2Z76_08790 [Treponemataceae bacterium]|nr:hypothetical protein [Treponemataceae bacterium]